MRPRTRRLGLVALSVLIATTLRSADVTVCPTGCDASSIQGGVDQASPGDVVRVAAGTYLENVTITKDVIIEGAGALSTIVDGRGLGGVFYVRYADAQFRDLTITNGGGPFERCGVYGNAASLTFERCVIRKNRGNPSGGIVTFRGDVTITATTIAENFGYFGGGAGVSYGRLQISNSAIYDNFAYYGGGFAADYTDGVTVERSTISGNAARIGGAALVAGPLEITHSTIVGNDASIAHGGISTYAYLPGTLHIDNSILSANIGGNCGGDGPKVSDGYNLSDDASCSFFHESDRSGIDPRVQAAMANGGPVLTAALLQDSPAIDSAGLACEGTDARGVAVPVDGDENGSSQCDVGAYERTPEDVPAIVDQEQLTMRTGVIVASYEPGTSAAQIVTPGLTGLLKAVRLPLECSGQGPGGEYGTLEIQFLANGLPDGVAQAQRPMLGLNLSEWFDPDPKFRTVSLSPPVPVHEGVPFAIVLNTRCGVPVAADGVDYPGGTVLFFHPTTGWVPCEPRFSACDIVFQAYVMPTGTAPTADAGADQVVECAGPSGAVVTLDGSGSSDDVVSFEWIEDLGLPTERTVATGELATAELSVGGHHITLRASNSSGESATDELLVTVADTTPPSISVTLEPSVLWPPNHRMVGVKAVVVASDLCGGTTVRLDSVTSDEADNGEDDGDTTNDVQDAETGTGDFAFDLRAERSGSGTGRTYTATYTAVDSSGNAATGQALAQVPHDQGGVTNPIELAVEETEHGTVLLWTDAPGALSYDVIRGTVSSLRETPTRFDLGPVICIEEDSPDTSTTGFEDQAVPAPGSAFFYLVQYDDGTSSSYGSVSTSKPRVPGPGTCVSGS